MSSASSEMKVNFHFTRLAWPWLRTIARTPFASKLRSDAAARITHSASLEIPRKFFEPNCFLGIGDDLAHHDGAFRRFFVSHDENVGRSECFCLQHLFCD